MAVSDFDERYGPWALIAGASTGLGAAFANEIASRGVNVVLLARRRELLEETANAIRQRHGVSTRTITVDLASPDLWDVVSAAVDDLEVGMLIYNAMYDPLGRFIEIELEEHLLGIAVNCTAPTILTYHLGRKMAERGRGNIVLVSSMAALQGIKIFASYGAGKAYELILAEGLWDELRDRGVDVVGYVVGATNTPHYQEVAASGSTPTSAEIKDLQEGLSDSVAAQRSPEEVAAALFPLLDRGPRQYSHPGDEAAANRDAIRSRRDVVREMGEMTSFVWG